MPPSSHIALARKWRPQRFEDVVGQRGVVETLRNAIASGRVAQSFIFAGPRGVGKTTTARIVARALNCVKGPTAEPCGECDACVEIAAGRDVDVMEIDAATYTGIDAVREVIVEPLAIAPMRDRFKIFIIDEVHRLSKQAFDALLKSIEEPPPYVKFMMATTELHAVPATIQSRSQLFELKALTFAAIRDELKKVASREKVKIDEGALALIARSAEGSMRDALSALDQVMAFTADVVTAADVSAVLGLIARDAQFEVAEIVAREDVAAAFAIADTIVGTGVDLRVVCRELARLMRDLLVVLIDPARIDDPEIAAAGERDRLKALAGQFSREDLLRAFDLLSRAEFEIRNSSQPRHHFEMALVKWIQLRHLTPLAELIAGLESGAGAKLAAPPASRPPVRPAAPADKPAAAAARAPAATSAPSRPASSPAASAGKPAAADRPTSQGGSASGEFLAKFQSSIKDSNKVFAGMVLAQARIEVEGDQIVFTFAPAHKSLRTQLEGKRAWLEQVAQSVSGRHMKVVARESAEAAKPAAAPAADPKRDELRARAKAEPTVQAVLDVFGGEIEDVEEIE